MSWLVFFGILLAMWLSVVCRVLFLHFFAFALYLPRDIFMYILRKKWRNCKTGSIICYVGLFGKGKTLSAVHEINMLYRKYDGKKVYDEYRRKWVTQKVHVVSNVDLAIPFERLISLAQVVQISDTYPAYDKANNTLTVHIILGDEFSVQLNSRSFKSNIDPLFLNTLLTCRHHHISLIYTAQRFKHVDALLRQVTSYVVDCNKCWRVMVHKDYDAFDLEYASNMTAVKPLRRYGWFIKNRDYAAYDTLACVKNLAKSCQEGDMLSEEQILALQQNMPADLDAVDRPSRKYQRRARKRSRPK